MLFLILLPDSFESDITFMPQIASFPVKILSLRTVDITLKFHAHSLPVAPIIFQFCRTLPLIDYVFGSFLITLRRMNPISFFFSFSHAMKAYPCSSFTYCLYLIQS